MLDNKCDHRISISLSDDQVHLIDGYGNNRSEAIRHCIDKVLGRPFYQFRVNIDKDILHTYLAHCEEHSMKQEYVYESLEKSLFTPRAYETVLFDKGACHASIEERYKDLSSAMSIEMLKVVHESLIELYSMKKAYLPPDMDFKKYIKSRTVTPSVKSS